MNDDDVLLLENMDESHWYGRNRNALLYDLVISNVGINQNILEIGCGTGTILSNLKLKGYTVTGIEPTTSGYNACVAKKLEVHNKYLEEYRSEIKFDCILLFDVLEHIEDDHSAILYIRDQLLAKNGKVIIAVPSSPALWSQVDLDVFHFRRYTFRSMANLLSSANLEVKFWRKWITVLYPLVFLHRKIFNSGYKNENQKPSVVANSFLSLILKFENKLNIKFLPSVSMMFIASRKEP